MNWHPKDGCAKRDLIVRSLLFPKEANNKN
jgi:hypothetical protein